MEWLCSNVFSIGEVALLNSMHAFSAVSFACNCTKMTRVMQVTQDALAIWTLCKHSETGPSQTSQQKERAYIMLTRPTSAEFTHNLTLAALDINCRDSSFSACRSTIDVCWMLCCLFRAGDPFPGMSIRDSRHQQCWTASKSPVELAGVRVLLCYDHIGRQHSNR